MFKKIFFLLFVRPFVLLVCGVYVRNKEYLPLQGPCIIVANHNSHLDTLVLLSLFPLKSSIKCAPLLPWIISCKTLGCDGFPKTA